ncbi:MAG: aldose 1-epimerase family protein [Actinomycetota bacterium]
MKIFNTELTKTEILKRIGDISQLCEIKYYEFIDGVSRGVRGIDIRNPEGINITILPDRGMDISHLSYKSIPFNWKSPTRETSPMYYESKGTEWLRTFYGGFLTTCGLTTTGPPNVDGGEELGLHGRIANIAAENVSVDGNWENDSYIIKAKGKVRESKVFGDKLVLERKICAWMDKPKLVLEDTVENIGHETSPLMILYHVNIGYPILDKYAELLESTAEVIPNDREAEKGLENFSKFSEPIKGFKEQCYFHDIQPDDDGYSNIAIVNEKFLDGRGMGIWLRFKKDNLPYLTQWKQMGMGEYVCGLEPCNNMGKGRKIERDEGRLRSVRPGEKINYRLEFNILKSNKEILDFKDKYIK